MGSSGGGGESSGFRGGQKEVGEKVDAFLNREYLGFENIGPARRLTEGPALLGVGLPEDARDAIRTGGFAKFNQGQLGALGTFDALRAGDPAFGSAQSAYAGNKGIDALRSLNIGGQQTNALQHLRQFYPDELAGLDFSSVQQQDPNLQYLRQTGSGQYLSPDSNPFLRESVEASQRPVLDAFREQLQPQLAAQFGGGFGLGGSASMNAQRLATRDVSRALSDSASQAYNQNFQQERARQDAANQFLGDLGLQRSMGLGQLRLGRAQGVNDARLARAGQLGELGLGFTNTRLERASQQAAAENQRARGLMDVGTARGNQRLMSSQMALTGGEMKRRNAERAAAIAADQFDVKYNNDLARLRLAAPFVQGGPGGVASKGRNRTAGAIGGATAGAATGYTVTGGQPYGALVGGLIGGIGGAM
ncbi:MAG: hypothetical protein ACR2QH_15355 [Geminicoccaceae bacterium]